MNDRQAGSYSAFIGVDVSAQHLDAAIHDQRGVSRFANDRAAIAVWLSKVPRGAAIAMESTGRYHEVLARAAADRGHTVFLLNPRDVRHYARSMGGRGKTDRLDAQLIARLVQREHSDLRPWAAPSAVQQRLDELVRRRAGFVKQCQAARMSVADSAEMKRAVEPLLAEYARLIKVLDKSIEQAARELDAGSNKLDLLRSVPGIGATTAPALLSLFTRLDNPGAEQVVAFVGLDPRPMDSGQKIGLRRLTKRGPAELRRLLFNAAMSASRTQAWRPIYEREIAKKLSRIAALNVLARRLLKVAFVLFRKNATFDALVLNPSRLKCA